MSNLYYIIGILLSMGIAVFLSFLLARDWGSIRVDDNTLTPDPFGYVHNHDFVGEHTFFTLMKASTRESIQTMKSLRSFSHRKVFQDFRQERARIIEAEGYEKHDFAFKSEICSYNRWLIAHDYARNVLLEKDYSGLMIFLSV